MLVAIYGDSVVSPMSSALCLPQIQSQYERRTFSHIELIMMIHRAPGTAKAGTNGCISNCGTAITNDGEKPDTIKRVGYFEAWNSNRPCLHIDIEDVDTDHYTHIHFGFGNLSAEWVPDMSGAQSEFEGFKNLTRTKRILSFGGWAFSTDPATYQVFRTGVQAANRQ